MAVLGAGTRGPWIALVLLCGCVAYSFAWQEWIYNSTTTEDWRKLWGYKEGPHGRRGHSMVLYGTQIILFGGRDNEIRRNHVPRTYEIENQNGTLEFTVYDESPANPSLLNCTYPGRKNGTRDSDYNPDYQSAGGVNGTEDDPCSNIIEVGLYYNDVWSYELNCERYADHSCQGPEGKDKTEHTWVVRHPGSWQGACKMVLGREICETPSERWLHGAAMFNDSTMLIYGGFSQRCEDYCDDLWSFDMRDNTWMEIYELGFFSDGSSPGKRYKFTVVTNGQIMWMFGGFRLWHGYSSDNSWENDWDSYDIYPSGGYLNDLWTYNKTLLGPEEEVPTESPGYGVWKNISSNKTSIRCFDTPGDLWSERNDRTCVEDWPKRRAGHVMELDKTRLGLWIHGGYTTYFPYLKTGGFGSATGTGQAEEVASFSPFPTFPFFLDDLWYYDLKNGIWTEIKPVSEQKPGPRVDHIMILSGHVLFLFGGYYHNHHNSELWLFNISNNRWLQKSQTVHPRYPEECTDDWEYIEATEECELLKWPKHLERDPNKHPLRYPGDTNARASEVEENYAIKPWHQQEYYVPDPKSGRWYYGIIDQNAELPFDERFRRFGSEKTDAIVPFAATGPNQYVRKVNNSELNGTVYMRCTSVYGEPTRGQVLGGGNGRSEEPIFIAQPRRQSPGWDGCRDRYDHLTSDLPAQLIYKHPSQRSDHKAIYIDSLPTHLPDELDSSADVGTGQHASAGKKGELYLFGGIGHTDEYLPSKSTTYPTVVRSDMWRLGIHECVNNCSNQGVCEYGYCQCYDGYYGVDCSNISCPGDFCYYDEITREQHCQHCCHSGYNHSDGETWIDGIGARKSPCNHVDWGPSNGICDGYGTCQCAPPFLDDDCSIKDCKDNCSFNGWCSVEYPISRCMCNPGYYGETCQYVQCLNNCSYPNGYCNETTGECTCKLLRDPYSPHLLWQFKEVPDSDSSRGIWHFVKWGGEDCSYLMAYSASLALRPSMWLSVALTVAAAAFLYRDGGGRLRWGL